MAEYAAEDAAKAAAEALIETITDGSLYIRGDRMKTQITQAMIDLVSGTDLTEEYVKNLVFVLESHGYDWDFNIDLAMKDFMGESREIYKKVLAEKTALYQDFGMSYSSAVEKANEEAAYSQLRTVLRNCQYQSTFEKAAEMLGYSEAEIKAFYKKQEERTWDLRESQTRQPHHNGHFLQSSSAVTKALRISPKGLIRITKHG